MKNKGKIFGWGAIVFFVMLLLFLCETKISASTRRVTVKNSSRVLYCKTYRLKTRSRKRTTYKVYTNTKRKRIYSIHEDVVRVTVTRKIRKTRYLAYTKKVTMTQKVKVTTTTTNYERSGKASVNQIKNLDPKVKEAFSQSGFKLETDKTNPLLQGGNGVFSQKNHKIVVAYNMDQILAHELGHFVSYESDNIAYSKDWGSIYQSEKKNFEGLNDTVYESSTQREYFAGVFAVYTINPSKLKKDCPKSYTYMKNVISHMNEE